MSASFDLSAHPIILRKPNRLVHSAWNGHIPFGMFLIELLAPNVLVELGTHTGASYCAFCQAIAELKLTTRAFAIDTWLGDVHSGMYGSEVLLELRGYHDPRYGHFSTLVPSSFDEALEAFEPSSIDLLHIDGLHTYDAVSHDYESWLPKMSKRGVMLFHDIAVTFPDFGVHGFWKEIKGKYSHFEMEHSSGLGVLAVGEEAGELLADLLTSTDDKRGLLLRIFEELGSRLELRVENERLREDLKRKEKSIETMECELIDFHQLARNPLVRLVRGTKRYGTLGILRKSVQRMTAANPTNSNTEGQYH